MDMIAELSKEFRLNQQHVGNIIALIDGNTIPFIARYRKEMTGSCDDQVLRELSDRLQYLRNLEKRKEEILESITVQGKMTDALSLSVQNAKTLAEAEDLYRPYRPKRRTRATIAQEKGLRPLADLIMAQTQRGTTLEKLAAPFVNAEKGVESWEDAVQGAQDILAEEISDDAEMRKKLRQIIRRDGLVVSRSVQENPVYEMYAEYSEPVSKIPSHRILAIDRGEKEECLKVKLELNDAPTLAALCDRFVKPGSVTSACVKEAVEDSWKRLIFPSLEREIRNELTQRAAKQAISMFALNLKPLLLQPPVKDKVIMGFDPAYRTGCKIAVVDATGKVLDTTVVYPTPPHKKMEEAKQELKRLIMKHGVTVISIGNGTASKESEIFVAELLHELETQVSYMVVSEAGASVYSASKLAAAEFPEFDVSLRSAYRAQAAGPPGGAGKNRPQSHRDRPVPARHAARRAGQRPGGRSGKLRQQRRGRFKYGVRLAFDSHFRPERNGRQKRGCLPGRQRPVPEPQPAEKGRSARAEGLRAVRGLSADSAGKEYFGQYLRSPGIVRRSHKAFGTARNEALRPDDAGSGHCVAAD